MLRSPLHGARYKSEKRFYILPGISTFFSRFQKKCEFLCVSVQRCRRLVISALKISAQTAAAACSCACPVHRRRAGGQGARASAWLLARATPRCMRMRGSHSTMRINDACAAWLSRCRAARADGGTRARSEATQITCPSSTARVISCCRFVSCRSTFGLDPYADWSCRVCRLGAGMSPQIRLTQSFSTDE